MTMSEDSKPRAACLIGWPAAHSRSPLIHHHWLRSLDIHGGYTIESVPPAEAAGFVLKLTAPDRRARAVGAANTLWYDHGTLRSTNTDVEGFIDNLDHWADDWDHTDDALVLGAGGSSRAVVFGLLERGIKHIHVANRSLERAEAIAAQFGPRVLPLPWDAIDRVLSRVPLLVNTTSLG